MKKRITIALATLSTVASAQGRPFSFTVPFPDGTPQTVVRYDGGWSNGSFEPLSGDIVQQTAEWDSPLGSRAVLMASGGAAFGGPTENLAQTQHRVTTRSMGQVEVLFDVLRFSGWHLAVSGGARRDFDGSALASSRVSLSRTTATWSFAANAYVTEPFAGAVEKGIPFADLTASVGATRNITSGISIGMETVVADAETLWSRGGTANSAIFLGPLVSFVLPGHRARLTLSGGPIVQTGAGMVATYTTIGKYAMPLHTGQTGYNLRLAVSMGL